jgi:Protein of unknown function (DUF4238)
MAGKRQHFIPQFIQSGFASHVSGDEVYTWVYRKDAKPFNTNIMNVGVEGYFYSQDGDNQLDDEITEAERSRFSVLVNSLRNSTGDVLADPIEIAELIVHLEARTRHFRQTILNTSEYLYGVMFKFFDDRCTFENYLRRRIPVIMQRQLQESKIQFLQELKSQYQNISSRSLELLLVGIEPLIEQQIESDLPRIIESGLESLLDNLSIITERIKAELMPIIKDATKAGHIKALKKSIAPLEKIRWYQNLQFCVLPSLSTNIPLGDSVLIFQVEGERQFKPFTEKDDLIEAVYLPLSSSLVLVGTKMGITPYISKLPMAIAQCSLEYFISDSQNMINDNLHNHIGEKACFLLENQLDDVLTKAIDKIISCK